MPHLGAAGADAGALGVASLPLYHAFAPLQRGEFRRVDSSAEAHPAGSAFERSGVHA